MSQFTTANLVGNRVLVKGTDSLGAEGSTVLDSTQWLEIQHLDSYTQAEEAFGKEIADFFRPITDAAEKFEAAQTKGASGDDEYHVIEEPVEATTGTPGRRVLLSQDTKVLRLIEDGHDDRLVWVGDKLEILELDDELPFEEDFTGLDLDEV